MTADLPPVTVVIDSCGSLHTYSVGTTGATFLGMGDLHDTSYDDLVVQGQMGTFATSLRKRVTVPCTHTINVYPTPTHQDYYETESPHVFAVGSAACFFFAILLFLFYDGYVRIQQNRVVGEAERSQALVASLFPTKVARRLFESDRSTHSVLDRSNHRAHLLNFVTKSEKRAAASGSPNERPIAELFPEATVMFAE